VFQRFEVVEIEATDGTALGIEVDVTTTRRSRQWSRGSSRSGAGLISWSRMRAAVVVDHWEAFRRYAGLDHDNYAVASFGDSPEMAAELVDLVIAGIKRATASLARGYGEGREPVPKRGDFVIVLDGEGIRGSSGEPQRW
jgi:hypothetical protein